MSAWCCRRCRARRAATSASATGDITGAAHPWHFSGYMTLGTIVIMEKNRLIEKHAASLGVPGVSTKWINLSGGGAQTDALLAGGVDILNTGAGNLLLLWDRTRGGVKGIVATSAQPMTLISRDANIKSIKDFGPNDKIAVPTSRFPRRRSCCRSRPPKPSAPTSGRSSTSTPCSSAIPTPMWR